MSINVSSINVMYCIRRDNQDQTIKCKDYKIIKFWYICNELTNKRILQP